MRLEIYPTTAKRLNEIVRSAAKRGIDRTGIWDSVIERAALLAAQDRNGGLVYPVHMIGYRGRYRPDRKHQEILRQLERLSSRDRWEFLSRAAREVLDREAVQDQE